MNQQTSYSQKASMLEHKKSNQALNPKESSLAVKSIQNTLDIAELARIMLGVISEENARKMTRDERHAFYNITNDLLSIAYKLS